ncbi:MAG: thymidine kinase [Myxococcota bacterium]|nr:thymidine kinase [Myxococcota bacterium]MDW8360941.1 thymidine kinase [Myxococcales bacterium]
MPVGAGWVEVIAGPMFSGKTEELIRRLRRARIARQRVQIFKPRIDGRYHASRVVSHSEQSIDAEPVADSAELLRCVALETRVVGIDEAQFFDAGLVEVCERLAAVGIRVIVAGLDQDYLGRPFEPMPALLAVAESVTKTLAICARCGAPAGRSQRLVVSTDRIAIGAAESYEPRCRRCHVPRPEPRTGELFADDAVVSSENRTETTP